MGSEPDFELLLAEKHTVFDDPTFVGQGAATLLGCMRQLEHQLNHGVDGVRHTFFRDPREQVGGWLVPTGYDVELYKAQVISGMRPGAFGCVQKWQAVNFPEAVGCADISEYAWSLRGICDRFFREPAEHMWELPAVEPDANRSRGQVGSQECFEDVSMTAVDFPSRLQTGDRQGSRARLRPKVHFQDEVQQSHVNTWVTRLNHIRPPAVPSFIGGDDDDVEVTGLSFVEAPAIGHPPGAKEGPRVTPLTRMLAQQVHLMPLELEGLRDVQIPQVGDLLVVGSPREGGRVPYDLFEPDQGRRTRQARTHWSLDELVQDAVHAVAYPVRCVHFPRRMMPRTYKPNIIMTPSRASRERLALPIDVRDCGGGIVTVLVGHAIELSDVVQQIADKAGAPARHFVEMFRWGQLRFTDSQGRFVETIVAPITQYEWLTVHLSPDGVWPATPHEDRTEPDTVEGPVTWPEIQLPPANLLFTHEPSDQSMIRAANMRIMPEALQDRDLFTSPTHSYKWARVTRDTLGYFTVFDTQRHVSIGECGVHSDMETLVAQAIQTAPFNVIAVQVLTDPVPDYPRPQLVLHQADRPFASAPLPWDLRGIGKGVKTVEHTPGQALLDALHAVDLVAPGQPGLVVGQNNGAIAVLDVLGPIGRILPRDLQSVQHFRVHFAPTTIRVGGLTGPRYHGGTRNSEGTTLTNTWAQALAVHPPKPVLRLLLFRGDQSVSADVSPPYTMIDRVVAHLLHHLSQERYLPVGAGVVLCGALPPPLGFVQEVPLVVVEPTAGVPYLWDARPIGGGWQLQHADTNTFVAQILSDSWRRDSWRVAVNGVPEEHSERFVRPGDYVQPFLGQQAQTCGPLGFVFDLCPQLEAYAWYLPVRESGLALASVASIFGNLASSVRARRHAMGAHFLLAGSARVYGAAHNEVRLHFPYPRNPARDVVLDVLADLTHPQGWHEITRAAVIFPDVSVFSSTPRGIASSTVLLPAPGHRDHFRVLIVRPGAQVLADLPADADTELNPRRRLRTGDVLYFRRDEPDGPEPASSDGQSLLQTRVARKPAVEQDTLKPGSVVPTPFGRRSIPTNSSKPVKLVLDECVPAGGCQSDVCEGPLHFPVPKEAVALAFGGFALSAYRAEVPDAAQMHPAARWLLSGLPVHARTQKPEAVLFFVDGSFKSPRASWAVVCVALVDGTWGWWGYLADRVDERVDSGDAFAGELFGQLVALCTIAHECLPATIYYDCESAARVSSCRTAKCAESLLRRAAASTAAYLVVLGRLPAMAHVKAHEGHPGNELADHVAKAALRCDDCRAEGSEQHFVDFVLEGSFDWLWAFPCSDQQSSLPQLQDECVTIPGPVLPDKCCFERPDQWAPQAAVCGDRVFALACKLASYNTLSCLSNLQRKCLQTFQENQGLAVLGLQECRVSTDPVQKHGHSLRFAGPAPEGQLGCQLWFNVSPEFGWARHSFRLAFSHPRLIVVYAQLGECRIACFSGHSPSAVASREAREDWWALLRQRLLALPANTAPLLMLDANARFELRSGQEVPCNNNAEAFTALLCEFGLSRSRAFEIGGAARQSWRPPDGSPPVCLDYLVWPSVWAEGFDDIGVQPILDEHVGIDHSPVVAATELKLKVPARGAPRLDRAAMCSEDGAARLRSLYATAPVIPWCVSLNDHLAAINAHLQRGLASMFPAQHRGPRKPGISEGTWALLQAKRQQRRCFRRQKALFSRWVLARCFSAWAHGPARASDRTRVKTFDQVAARHIRTMRELTAAARQAQKQDDAAFVRQAFASARDQGPDALAKQIRSVLRSGRNTRIAEVAVEIEVHGQKVSEPAQVKAAFAAHFGLAEHATPTRLDALPQCHEHLLPGPVHLEQIPSVSRVAAAFASLKSHKAAGIAQLPSETYSRCPLQAALLHMPILMKICSRRQFPPLWAGMLACALPKPNKSQSKLDGFRSVALVEPAAKGILKATRPALSTGLEQVALPTIGGARKCHPTDLAALSTQCHLSHLKRNSVSGAVLYLDGVSAFYAVHRGHLFGGDLAALTEHIRSLPLEAAVRSRVEAAISDRGALDRAGVPAGTQQLLRIAFASTWFVVDTQQPIVQATERGTTPGSPLADILYQFISEVSLRCLAEHLQAEGIAAICGSGSAALPQSWLDDVALLVGAPQALQVGQATARAASLAHQYLAVTGVDINYAAGKTEAVLVLVGPGATKARHQVFVEANGCLDVGLPDGTRQRLRCVAEYTHLGTVRTHNASCEVAICKREGLTRAILQPFKRRVMANNSLTCRERQELFKAMVLAKYLHGVGTLELGSKHAFEMFCRKYVGLVHGVVRPLHGVPCRRLGDSQVCALLNVSTPQEAFDIAIVRTWAYVAERGDAYLQSCVQGTDWMRALGPALARVAAVLEDSRLAAYAAQFDGHSGHPDGFVYTAHQTRNILRIFRRKCLLSRTDLVDGALRKARAHDKADKDGLAYYRVACDRLCRRQCFICPDCALPFDTAAALGSHRAKVHMHNAASAFGFGTACEACRKQFWATARLREHLRKSHRCARVYLEADWEPCQEREVLADGTMPPVPLVGPALWWSTQSFDEVVRSPVNPAHPDPMVLLSSLTDVHHLAPFFRTWIQAVESGWEPPLFLPRSQVEDVASLAVQIVEALGVFSTARVLQSGELAAIVQEDAVLCGRTSQIREAFSSYWCDL